MSIRVTQNTMYNTMVSQMQRNLSAYMETTVQGSTQKKINRPSDDPAGMYRVLTGRDAIDATKQYRTNVDTAKGWLQLGMDTLGTQVTTAVTRLKELANQASSGSYSAENRRQMSFEVREIFGQLLNYSNMEFNGNSIFAGHKYDKNAFEMGLAATTWDENWQSATVGGVEQKPPQYTIVGSSEKSVMVQFTSDGNVGVDALTYRWSNDGGQNWNDGTLAAGDRTISAGSVTLTVPDANPPLRATAADISKGPGANNGTLLYIRPTAIYQGDDKDPPPETVIMGGQVGLGATATGTFKHNVLVRMDTPADLSQGPGATPPTAAQDFTYSYSTDSGSTWVTAQGKTTGTNSVRLPVPGGFMDYQAPPADPVIPAGTQVIVHPNRSELDFEILKDTYLPVNSVGKDIFGGYYQGKPSLNKDGNLDANLFEVVGNFIGYLEGNNQEGCQKVLAALTTAESTVLTEAARLGGLENRVEMAQDVLSFQKLDQEERLSYTEDIDLTELLTKLTRQQLTYNTVLKSSSMIMQMSLSNYL